MNMIFLPIDERFATRGYFLYLARLADVGVLTPPMSMLGKKKHPADIERIYNWLLSKGTPDVDYLIASVDLLLYGGLVPSRISIDSSTTLLKRLRVLEEVKRRVPRMKIFISSSIQRIPDYNSDDEEPQWFAYLGKTINKWTRTLAKYKYSYDQMALHTLKEITADIPSDILNEFVLRRYAKMVVNKRLIHLIRDGVVDFLNITLDDNGRDSLSAHEGKILREYSHVLGVEDKVSIHSGADEANLSMLSRAITDQIGEEVEFYISYALPEHKDDIPFLESEPLSRTIEAFVNLSGGKVSNEYSEDGILMVVNNFSGSQTSIEYPFASKKRRLFEDVMDRVKRHKGVDCFIDLRYSNAGDPDFVEKTFSLKLPYKKVSYAGWNTASNSIGSAVTHAIILYLFDKGYIHNPHFDEVQSAYLFLRFLEDWGYQAHVRNMLRQELMNRVLWKQMDIPDEFPYSSAICTTDLERTFCLVNQERWAVDFVKNQLSNYADKIQKYLGKGYNFDVYFPWHRTFEIGIGLSEEERFV
ncbi:MAG: DUF4127 family protein [Thermotogae bacterium]|nr:DUF4127 family protein [Thermotogota bacterium]